MTVEENVALPIVESNKAFDIIELNKLVAEKLELVGLPGIQKLKPSELSGGMKKRVGLARALITNPDYILYDEPTTGLDPSTSREISQLVLEVQKKYKTTSIIVTHDMECARMVADRIVVLKDGEYIVEGTFDELQKSDDPFVKSFFEGLNF